MKYIKRKNEAETMIENHAAAKLLLSRLAERGETFQWGKCPRHLLEAVKIVLMGGYAVRYDNLDREIARIEESYRNECERRALRGK